MKRKRTLSTHFAVCMENTGYPSSLELHKIYRVIPDEDTAEDGGIRVVDESGFVCFVGREAESRNQ